MPKKHEREQTLTPQSSPSPDCPKRPKTQALISSPISPHSSKEKGKAKIEQDEKDNGERGDQEMDLCGICLSEEGKAIRGQIDSCDHYFCFVCIMEWSKLESKCPICKQRFGSIRRLPKEGVFSRERIVQVPVRDQVYHPLGNGTTGPSDPYEDTCCTECQTSENESLLLLCDLCDSAAHTYCVGLGRTVPEGDWYCHDCSVSRNEHSDQLDNDCRYQNSSRTIGKKPAYEADISISEIVREERSLVVREVRSLAELARDRSIFSEEHGNQVERNSPPRKRQSQSSSLPPKQSSSAAVSVKEPEQGPRTLHQCRNLHGRIRAMRENWNALRNGSVMFSLRMLNSGGRNNIRRKDTGARIHGNSSEPQPLVSKTAGEDSVFTKNTHDVERAWKMMEVAKSIEGTTGVAGSGNHCTPNHPVSKNNVLKETRNRTLSFSILNSKPSMHKNEGGIPSEKCQKDQARNENISSSILNSKPSTHKVMGGIPSEKSQKELCPELVHKKWKSRACENQKLMIDIKDMHGVDIRFPVAHLSGYSELQSSKQAMESFQEVVSHLPMRQPSNLYSEGNVPYCSGRVIDYLPRVSDLSFSSTKPIVSSNCNVDPSREIVGVCRKVDDAQRKDDGAKCEVQALVKLNLKLLSKDKQLGADKFKEVARLATHTILAACGLEHTKSSVRPFPSWTCTHTLQSQKCRASNLMPSSCRECFYVFVKNVVDSIMAETTLNTSILKN
ncbi:hypothetical protein AAC387_Pa03g2942 [Persea americana]